MTILANHQNFVRAGMTWGQHMKQAIRDPETLAKCLNLPIQAICQEQSQSDFPLFVPLPYLSRIELGNRQDPLLLQVLPTTDENSIEPGYSADPLQEKTSSLGPGLLQKYDSRVLLVTTGACAIHCRYCFRREFPYSGSPRSLEAWKPSLQKIQSDPTVSEVILSGGDPLTLVDSLLEQLINRIESIDHITRLRIHTRLPVVIPQRVTETLTEMIRKTRLHFVVVIHTNHANELDEEVKMALQELNSAGAILLNQSVLLRNVNDSVNALKQLSERLIECGVTPYYLHQLDKVNGAGHFHVSVETGLQLIEKLRAQASGYLVPRYVQEVPGAKNKTVL